MADAVAPVNSEAPLRPVNPATGQVVGEVPCSTEPDVSASVKRARKAQPAWGATTPARRAAALRRAGEAVAAHADELAALVTAEMGKPRGAALAEALDVSHRLRGVEPLLPALEPKEHRAGAVVTRVLRDPLGVVAVITPWNFPLTLAEMLISPAILAGNSVVFKPSELSPLSGSRLHGLLAGGLPPGVLELVQGRSDVGRALVASDVQMIAFVGSLVVGKAIMREAARNLKRLVLELGGNDAMLVLEDADVEASADFAVQCGFRNAGQVCVSVGRVYVHEAIAEDFVEAVVQRTRSLRVGSGEGDDVQVGPLASAAQLQRILSRLEEARQRGARVIVGGRAIPGPGFFLEPAVVVDVTDDLGLMREETFGPVLAIRRVRDADEGVRLTNDSPYGLGATVWSSDRCTALAIAARLEVGMVGINRAVDGVAGMPWVGAKQSGFGFVRSLEGVRQFTQTRTITF